MRYKSIKSVEEMLPKLYDRLQYERDLHHMLSIFSEIIFCKFALEIMKNAEESDSARFMIDMSWENLLDEVLTIRDINIVPILYLIDLRNASEHDTYEEVLLCLVRVLERWVDLMVSLEPFNIDIIHINEALVNTYRYNFVSLYDIVKKTPEEALLNNVKVELEKLQSKRRNTVEKV